jgi:predicted acylesterase/phospholipase RssA
VIASGLTSMRSQALSAQAGHFRCLDSFMECLRASMCVPGVAGPVVRLGAGVEGEGDAEAPSESEPMADALVFEPIPYRSAVEEGCTHVLTLRSRPDGSEVGQRQRIRTHTRLSLRG